jgi:hypothetical protein
MPGLVCASCGYQWNLPENTRCGRCLQTLAFRPAATAGAGAGAANPHRSWFERPRNLLEFLCFLPVLVGFTSGGLRWGGLIGSGIGIVSSVVLLRIAHVPADSFTRGLLMALVLMGAIAAYVFAWHMGAALFGVLHLSY